MAAADSNAALRYLSLLDEALLAKNTRLGYQADWRHFERFCTAQGFPSLPASTDTVALFIATRLQSGRKVSTVTRNVAAIAYQHRERGMESPSTERIREILRGARRLKGEPARQAKPLSIEHLREMAEFAVREDTAFAYRNRAIIVVGFASGLRTASLAQLQLGDVEFTEKGAVLHVRRSKGDQEGRGLLIGLPPGEKPATCPVNALKGWIERRGRFPGPLFIRFDPGFGKERALEPERIGQIVQELAVAVGLRKTEYSGHSLRAGFVTAAGEARCSELAIAAVTGHRDMATLRKYFRKVDLWRGNPAGMIGL
jgi:site-specific recombinase XerD